MINRSVLTLVATILALALPACVQTPGGATAPAAAGDYYVFQRVVYQNSGGLPDDKAYFQRLLRNVGAHVSATEGKVEIRVVSFSAGVKVFQTAKTDPDLAKAIDAARATGKVKFLICRNTLRAMNLTPADLHGVSEADVIPSGVAEIARLQGQGFVYIHP
jgi:intracellular sulfur oxidation DsrE/DsrF family protein